jgi:transposase
MARIWAGMDIGKEHHHCVVIDADGRRLLSRRILNDEAALRVLISDVIAISLDVLWAVDLNHGGASLLIALLTGQGQPVAYLTGLAVHRASGTYRGEGKTDARDAFVIADQARVRRDLGLLRPGDEIAVDLRILTTRRADLVEDRTRQINRLRAQLLEIFPALERAFDYSKSKAALVLLTGYQTPAAIRLAGTAAVESWLRSHHARNASAVARAAGAAAQAQHTAVPGQSQGAAVVARLAAEVMSLDEQIAEVGALIEARFRDHPLAGVILSLPGVGAVLGAEFIAATGGDMTAFGTADRLAAFAGLAPAPRDSGRVTGNLHRPRHYHRGLLRVFYLSSMISIRSCPASRAYYDRKRAAGKTHTQAVLALSRRRASVLWAMIRDGQCYQDSQPVAIAA